MVELSNGHNSQQPSKTVIQIGSRDSELAKLQSNIVIDLLRKELDSSKYDFNLVTMKTIGDQILDKPLAKTGEKNLFTRELEMALAEGKIDMIVHSLKDLTTTLEDNFEIGAVLKRESPYDAVVVKKSLTEHSAQQFRNLKDLPDGFRIGTSSLRRTAQLSRRFPQLKFSSIRGNLNTRLRKLDDGDLYDAIILAEAGLVRLGWKDRISFLLDYEQDDSCLYAVGQGALAVEIRKNDSKMMEILKSLNDENTVLRCLGERAFLKQLDGGCSTPIGVHSSILSENEAESSEKDVKLKLIGRVLSLNGDMMIEACKDCVLKHYEPGLNGHNDKTSYGDAPKMKTAKLEFELTGFNPCIIDKNDSMLKASSVGVELAKELLSKGAKSLLDDCKETIRNEVLNGKVNPQSIVNKTLVS